jgi:hypothetical protein
VARFSTSSPFPSYGFNYTPAIWVRFAIFTLFAWPCLRRSGRTRPSPLSPHATSASPAVTLSETKGLPHVFMQTIHRTHSRGPTSFPRAERKPVFDPSHFSHVKEQLPQSIYRKSIFESTETRSDQMLGEAASLFGQGNDLGGESSLTLWLGMAKWSDEE